MNLLFVARSLTLISFLFMVAGYVCYAFGFPLRDACWLISIGFGLGGWLMHKHVKRASEERKDAFVRYE